MTYTVVYTRKVRTGAYETMEIGLHKQSDETRRPEDVFKEVRDQVEKWIQEERDKGHRGDDHE